MDRLPPLNALLLWGASFYLVTHGVLPPASTEAEARELAEALREAAVAWVEAHVRAARAWAAGLLSAW
ncbi:MAG TPA: hypothetical protein VN323_15495 [Candidatus Dormibacteraeota bacterium]|jgi:hypothetical protein|nr:hypothetical protein [Candidatus Dormibacteraeota bacterium]